MGYRRPRRTIRLVFEDGTRAGLEVRARSVSVGKVLHLMDLADALRSGASRKSGDQLFHAFADALEGWNLEDEDDAPVPATYEGLMDQDFDFAMDLVLAWMDGITSTSGPLGRSSGAGRLSPLEVPEAPSIPMEVLSPNLVS